MSATPRQKGKQSQQSPTPDTLRTLVQNSEAEHLDSVPYLKYSRNIQM